MYEYETDWSYPPTGDDYETESSYLDTLKDTSDETTPDWSDIETDNWDVTDSRDAADLAALNAAAPSSIFSGLNVSDITKFLSSSPVLSGLVKTLGAAGVASLADKLMGVTPGPTAYSGGIPTLTASRQQMPIPTTMTDATGKVVPRRPGSGGITYFSPMQYLSPAQAQAQAEAAKTTTPVTPPAETTKPPEIGRAAGGITSLDGYAGGGSTLGNYSDGGRLLRGPGDGVSDSIPATIGNKRPARLADGEFVIPARIVSELGNGSTEAGARKLYAMMDRIKKARGKAKNIAADTKAYKHLPA